MRCSRALLRVLVVLISAGCARRGGGRVHAFSRIPPFVGLPQLPTTSKQLLFRCSSSPSYLLASTTTTTTTASDQNADQPKPKKYHWLRPTLGIAVPALIGMMADPLLSLMDTAFVGHVGALELASLGACTSIFHLAFNAFRATTTATTSLVASALHHNPQEAKEVTQLSLTLGVIIGLCVMVILRGGGTWCLKCMGIASSSNLFPPAHAYLQARAWAAPAVLFIVVSEGAFRGYGNTKIPLLASGVAAMINLMLDPLLMFPMGMGVRGAAVATALSQLGAAVVYAIFLQRHKMLPQQQPQEQEQHHAVVPVQVNRQKVIQTILRANVAMMAKQGSLLLAWAYATSKATRLGAAHVAAHQVALSFWLVFALWLDGAAVSAQVLMSRACAKKDLPQMRSLSKFMIQFATWQGLASTVMIAALGTTVVPRVFTSDPTIRLYLHHLMPHLAAQQVLISLTLVVESLAVGAHQFNLLAAGTTVSTVLAVYRLSHATNVLSIWSNGIVTLFAGRFVTALIGTARANEIAIWKNGRIKKSSDNNDDHDHDTQQGD